MVAVGTTQGKGGSLLVEWRAELAAAGLAVLLYLPTLAYGFVFDDLALISADGHPLPLGGAIPYRPLRYASYLLDSALGGAPLVYHAHNVVLHALVAALVVALARRLGAPRPAALAGGLLLAFHPLAVEAAAYVSGRRDLLCMALGLTGVLLHLSGRTLVALGLVVLSAAAKESGLVFFAPLVLATTCGLDGPGRRSSSPVATRGLVATAVAGVAVGLVVAYGAVGPWTLPASQAGLLLPGIVTLHYLGTMTGLVAPAPEYPWIGEFVRRAEAGDAAALVVGGGTTLLVVLVAAAALLGCQRAGQSGRPSDRHSDGHGDRRRERAFVAGWTMAVVTALALWGGLHEPGADRHAYLLLAPLGLLLAQLLAAMRPRSHGRSLSLEGSEGGPPRVGAPALARAVFVAAGVLLFASAAASREQMKVWESERSLWSYAASLDGASPRAHANLARSLAGDGRLRAASRHMDTALEADPEDPLLYMGRAAVRCARGFVPLARRDLRRARRMQQKKGGPAPAIDALARECESTVGRPPDRPFEEQES